MAWRLLDRLLSRTGAALLTVALVATGSACTTRIESASLASGVTEPALTTTTSTTTTPRTTVPPTTTSTTSTTTSTTSTTSTSTTTTTVAAPVVGGFTCIPAGQAPTIWELRPPSVIPPPAVPADWRTASLGVTTQGRPIEMFVRPVVHARRRVVVIGGIHGNEPVTPPVVRDLINAQIPADVEVWLVPVANPDGSAAGLRCNANGVDLNRNFSWEWRAEDGGPGPLSEPETQALAQLVEQLRPDLVVWVHQPLGYVSSVGETDAALENAWSAASGLPVRPDVTQHGGGESWSSFVVGVPSMLIEIDGWDATLEMVNAQRAGFEAMLAALG